ncbi:MAG TPA: TetR/AcrR family transcriptional regulator C-terminal domain-containing protein [Sphingomonadaceae bacterium]|nr:TetR/AcrR family transcriptional regulator C-terminal domain-containing protein [Sphingomonadaceae bacterium]
MKLDQKVIVDAALALLDEEGLDGFNLRALAARLSVQAPALYWHVGGGKAELFSLMAMTFYARALKATAEENAWRGWLLRYGRTFRAALLSHRDSARLCAIARPRDQDSAAAGQRLAAPLVRLGLAEGAALSFQGSVNAFTLGWALYQQSGAMHDYLAGMYSFDESFETGLTALVGGFPDSIPA